MRPASQRRSGPAELEARAREIGKRLARVLPAPRCELDHRNAWQLLIATILSAQSTDARVNLVTPALFERYKTAEALGSAELADVEELVRTTGFYRNKARAIVRASQILAERHGGEVPHSLEALIELPGVARKTANVVLGTACGLATGVVVDTHVTRVSQRLGLSRQTDPVRIEQDLCDLFPKTQWIALGHRLVLHGRYLCKAQKPSCADCPLNELCPSAGAKPRGSVAERSAHERGLVPA